MASCLAFYRHRIRRFLAQLSGAASPVALAPIYGSADHGAGGDGTGQPENKAGGDQWDTLCGKAAAWEGEAIY